MFNTVLFREEKNGNNLLSYNKELGTSMTQSYNGILDISLITDVNKCLKIWENIHDPIKKLHMKIYIVHSQLQKTYLRKMSGPGHLSVRLCGILISYLHSSISSKISSMHMYCLYNQAKEYSIFLKKISPDNFNYQNFKNPL